MFGRGHFEGDFRTKPNVSIRGATKSESKEELLKRAHDERLQREAKRKEHSSAIKIQSLVRGFLTRVKHKKFTRDKFSELQKEVQTGKVTPDLNTMHMLGVLLLSSWDQVVEEEGQSLSWLCQLLVKQRELVRTAMEEDRGAWVHMVCRMLHIATGYLSVTSDTRSGASLFRLLEIFTSETTYSVGGTNIVTKIYRYLVSCGYFSRVRQLADRRIPPLLEATKRPPTPVSGEILHMVLRPLQLVNSSNDGVFVNSLLQQLCRAVLCQPFSEQIQLFILPSLADPGSKFPLGRLVSALQGPTSASLTVPSTPWLLYSFLAISRNSLSTLNETSRDSYLAVLSCLSVTILEMGGNNDDKDEDSDNEDDMEVDSDNVSAEDRDIIRASLVLINEQETVSRLVEMVEVAKGQRCYSSSGGMMTFDGSEPTTSLSVERQPGCGVVKSLCKLCHHLLMHSNQALHDYCLLYTLAFHPSFLHQLWNLVRSSAQVSLFGSPTPLLSIISRGLKMSPLERDELAPLLAVFCSLFRYLLVTIHDTEFYGEQSAVRSSSRSSVWMPFLLEELVPMSMSLRDVALGLVELAFPESRPAVRDDYKQAVSAAREESSVTEEDTKIWSHLFRSVVSLVRQLYTRDTRRQFCPANHWISRGINLPLDRPSDITFRRSRIRQYRPFRGLRVFTREELEEEGPPLSTKEVRLATVLRELPFSISFSQRVLVFQNLIQRDRQEHQGDRVNFLQGNSIDVLIRRNYIYEDAFEKLSPENEPNMRLKMRIQLVNAAGMDEAGIDGGGLFREFLSQLLKTAFDPNRAFFRLTNDQMLYPHPTVSHIHSDSSSHYYFIGRMLGKALYENMLVELPLASFFLSKLLGQQLVNVDIDHLDSLDPELYRNLLKLKTYDGDVQELGLDFTIVVEELGEARVELLKPDGDSISVTNENRIEYIHLVADYKLNKQIKNQCNAFRAGLADVIHLDWLRMFSYRELQTLISGAEMDISVSDLQAHTNYSGGYGIDHPTITAFWRVVVDMTEDQKRSLLKFVTSCSRPPLLGFKDLDPPFCIQNAGSEPNRLPTASTCMNLLKLPDFKDAAVLKMKLLYAIESGAGFELS